MAVNWSSSDTAPFLIRRAEQFIQVQSKTDVGILRLNQVAFIGFAANSHETSRADRFLNSIKSAFVREGDGAVGFGHFGPRFTLLAVRKLCAKPTLNANEWHYYLR